MSTITNFRDLIVWQKAHKLTLDIYGITAEFPKFEEYGLSSQMRRSASSVPTNVAEGFKRKSDKDSLRFYNMSECSLEELKYQLILSKDLGYITKVQFESLNEQAEEVSKLLNGWIKCHKR